jgi:hypothetical protein
MTLRARIAFVVATTAVAGCDTDAVGIEDCRRIEQARCEVARPCRDNDFDVDDCKRFYRDHCLHGVALEEAPSEPDVDRCVLAIRTAGACAAGQPDAPIASCGEPPLIAVEGLTACGAIEEPTQLADCAFLVPEQEPIGAGGTGGTPSTGGASGMAGAG